jgi:hypothetical protein
VPHSGRSARLVDRPSKRRVARHRFEGSGPDAAKSASDKPAWLVERPIQAPGEPGGGRAGRSCAQQSGPQVSGRSRERPAPPRKTLGGEGLARSWALVSGECEAVLHQ